MPRVLHIPEPLLVGGWPDATLGGVACMTRLGQETFGEQIGCGGQARQLVVAKEAQHESGYRLGVSQIS